MVAKKTMILGLDAPIVSRLIALAEEGTLPNIKGLMDRGVVAENCLVPYPTITSSNWTTIATGAWPGTHGITGYSVHNPGDPLDVIHGGFDSSDNLSETLWEVAEREGRKSIVFDWPASWPPKIKDGIIIGGGGVGVNSWRVAHHNQRKGVCLGSYQLFSTEEYPFSSSVDFVPAEGWLNLDAEVALEARVELSLDTPPEGSANDLNPRFWYLLLLNSMGNGYDRLLISESKDVGEGFADISPGQWTPNIEGDFETKDGKKRGAFRCKLLTLSPDAREFKLYVTIINALEGWSYPESVAREIRSDDGLPSPRDGYFPLILGWIDLETLVELAEFQHTWTADALSYLLANKEWDLLFLHSHCPDWMYHTFSSSLDPLTNPDRQDMELHVGAETRLYQSLDRMIGRILEHSDDETIVVVTSDHGAKAKHRGFKVRDLLIEKGLTVPLDREDPVAASIHGEAPMAIDWSKTRAFAQRICYVYVNLKGRDPDGIVEPGGEYEDVRNEIIHILYDCTDEETGLKPVSLALKREDARILGLYGDTIGDVVYALDPEFGGEHGNFLPTAGWGIGSMKGLLIMSGPGIKRGTSLKRSVWLTDIIPTVCHLVDLPIPRDSEGAIIHQAFEDKDLKLKEMKRSRDNYRRIVRAFSSSEAETHRHGT
jgi:predicted AlkP superfamily phosphohydrolase/phosphomutase